MESPPDGKMWEQNKGVTMTKKTDSLPYIIVGAFFGLLAIGIGLIVLNHHPEPKKIQFGELLDETDACQMFNDNAECERYVLVIEAKIKPSYNNHATITQNYHNIEYYVKNNDVDKFQEIQYWAKAEMVDGEDRKVISFTVPKRTIKLLKEERIVATQLENYVDDLWIIRSLREDK